MDWNAGVPPATSRSDVRRLGFVNKQKGLKPQTGNMPIDYNFQPKGLKSIHGWYDRGRLPHFDGGSISQFLTFRLYDSVPQELIEEHSYLQESQW
jgi:hypothetical protein